MCRTFVITIILFACAFGTGCDLTRPAGQDATDSGREFHADAKTRYLGLRGGFRTKLIRKGSAPQDWENEKPGRFIREIKYPSGKLSLKASLYIPDNDEKTRRPALIFCHGGFANGTNELLCVEPFLNGNYVVMGPSWRGENGNSGHFELMLGEVEDAANAARWLAKQPYVDPENIYMFGHSIGGGISAVVTLLDNVPLRHTGGSGGMYYSKIFEAWKDDVTPFDYRDLKECRMRMLVDNTDSMLRKHYAYIGNGDDFFLPVVEIYQSGDFPAPLLYTELVPGDHFTSFDGAVQRYFRVVEKDRKGTSSKPSTSSRPTVSGNEAAAKFNLTATYVDPKVGFRFNHDPAWVKQDRNGPVFLITNRSGVVEAAFMVQIFPKDPKLLKSTRKEMEQAANKLGRNGKLLDFKKAKFKGVDCLNIHISAISDNAGRCIFVNNNFNFGDKCLSVSYFAVETKFEDYTPLFNAVLDSFQLP